MAEFVEQGGTIAMFKVVEFYLPKGAIVKIDKKEVNLR
jgi:hypothetical protein